MFNLKTDTNTKKKTIKKDDCNGLPLFFFPKLLDHPGILHFITTRQGGYSQRPFDTFNLAFHVGDEKVNVVKNRLKLAQSLHISIHDFTVGCQVGGVGIRVVKQNQRGSGADQLQTAIRSTDAMITDQKGICLVIFVADCVPVFLYDYQKKVIALVHAGWKGTLGLIVQKTLEQMRFHWGSKPRNILCALGPSIGPCCYQVGPEIIEKVRNIFPYHKHLIHSISADRKGYLDLWEANYIQLLDCGISERNIEIARLCTYCHSDIFFSSRKDSGRTGRFAAGIMLRSDQ